MPYRIGVYERLGNNEFYEFELLHGKSEANSKKRNYEGEISFKASKLKSFYLPVKTNNGESSQQILPFLFFSLMKRNPDVILSEGASGLINATMAFLYAKLFRKKYIWWSLGRLEGRQHKGLRAKIDKWIHFIERHSDAIFTYSTQGANHFIRNRGIPAKKIFVSVNVIDTEKKLNYISSLKSHKNKEFHIVFVGAIIKVKRLEILIDAFNNLSKKYSNIYLDIIGDGDYADVIKRYLLITPNDRIIMHGRKIGVELSQMLMDSSVLVLPGLGGLAICDGMLHSLPVICGSADGTELDLLDETCGFITSTVTKNFLENKLEYLITNPDVAEKMGKNSYTRITKEFPISAYMENLYKCIDSVFNKL